MISSYHVRILFHKFEQKPLAFKNNECNPSDMPTYAFVQACSFIRRGYCSNLQDDFGS